MSKFMEIYNYEKGLEPLEEGWGTALGRLAHYGGMVGIASNTASAASNLLKGNMAGVMKAAGAAGTASKFTTYGGYAGQIIGILSNMNLKKLLNHPAMKKYLEGECAKLLKEEQKKDKSVVAEIPTNIPTLVKRWWHNNDEVGFFSKPNFLQQHDDWIDDLVFELKVGKFTTTFWYDTNHIDAAVVIFYSKDKDTCLGRRIPAPSNAELKQMFHD